MSEERGYFHKSRLIRKVACWNISGSLTVFLVNGTAMSQRIASGAPNSDQPYDPEFFMEKHGISRGMAKVILHVNGPSRNACDAVAAAFLRFEQWREAGQKPPAPSIKS